MGFSRATQDELRIFMRNEDGDPHLPEDENYDFEDPDLVLHLADHFTMYVQRQYWHNHVEFCFSFRWKMNAGVDLTRDDLDQFQGGEEQLLRLFDLLYRWFDWYVLRQDPPINAAVRWECLDIDGNSILDSPFETDLDELKHVHLGNLLGGLIKGFKDTHTWYSKPEVFFGNPDTRDLGTEEGVWKFNIPGEGNFDFMPFELNWYVAERGGRGGVRHKINRHEFDTTPGKFNQSILDCKNTENEQDCALRCLAIGYLKHFKRHINAARTSVEPKYKETEKKFTDYVGRVRKSVKRGVDGPVYPRLFYDIDKLRGVLMKTYPEYSDRKRMINYEHLEDLCCRQGLGYNVQIKVAVLNENAGMSVVWTSRDRRKDVLWDPRAAEVKEEPDAKRRRLSMNPWQPEILLNTANGVPPQEMPLVIFYLLLHQNHFQLIARPGIISRIKRKFCDTCNTGYKNDREHYCLEKCSTCFLRSCDLARVDLVYRPPSIHKKCDDCNRTFATETCFDCHKQVDQMGRYKGKSTCDLRWRCEDPACMIDISVSKEAKEDHKHGHTMWCAVCGKMEKPKHECWIRSTEFLPLPPSKKLRFFDLETFVYEDTHTHECNHAQVMDEDGSNHKMFANIHDFCSYVFADVGRERETDDEPNIRYIAHNGGRFDFQLVVRECLENWPSITVNPICRGARIVTVSFCIPPPKPAEEDVGEGHVENVVMTAEARKREAKRCVQRGAIHPYKHMGIMVDMVDSFSFLSMPLRNMSETFGIDTLKGDFPHHFNNGAAECWTYKGPIPQLEDFGINTMPQKRLKEVTKWYLEQVALTTMDTREARAEMERVLDKYGEACGFTGEEKYVFEEEDMPSFEEEWDFKYEMERYCFADVDLLRKACLKFRETMMTCYKPKASKTYQGKSKGDPLPMPDPFSSVTIASYCHKLYLKYFYKHKSLRNLVLAMERIIRRGFSGGRTETFAIYKRVREFSPGDLMDEIERILKVDFCSEYPFVNMYGVYLKDAPVEIGSVEDFNRLVSDAKDYDCHNMSGVLFDWAMKVDHTKPLDKIGNPHFTNGVCFFELSYEGPILPIPVAVLGSKQTVKLQGEEAKELNDLRRYTSLDTEIKLGEQLGDEDARIKSKTLNSTWANKLVFGLEETKDVIVNSLELYEALDAGYHVTQVNKIWWWKPSDVIHGLFADYVNVFLGMKIEAKGWPKDCVIREDMTEDEMFEALACQTEYVEKLRTENPGIVIDPSRIENKKNPGKYFIAKLLLNSLWGKFVQRNNLEKREYVGEFDYDKYFRIFSDKTLKATWKEVVEGKVAEIRYKHFDKDVFIQTKDTSVVVGALTTAQGRLMLWRKLKKLAPDQPLYCDTDSIMYVYDPLNAEHVKLETREDVLGELSNEFDKYEKQGLICTEYISGGPKNYGYMFVQHDDPNNEAKRCVEYRIKGHNLHSGHSDNEAAKHVLTYTRMKRVILTNCMDELRAKPWSMFSEQELQERVIEPAIAYRPSPTLYEEDCPPVGQVTTQIPQDEKDGVEEVNILDRHTGSRRIRLKYKGKFRLQRNLTIKMLDTTLSYGWTYDKGEVDYEHMTSTNIRCVPHGYFKDPAPEDDLRLPLSHGDEDLFDDAMFDSD